MDKATSVRLSHMMEQNETVLQDWFKNLVSRAGDDLDAMITKHTFDWTMRAMLAMATGDVGESIVFTLATHQLCQLFENYVNEQADEQEGANDESTS